MVREYRKKPVVISAVLWDGNDRTWQSVLDLADKHADALFVNADGSATIETLEGAHRANVGDYIIRGVKGELYPCKPDIFAATYDEV